MLTYKIDRPRIAVFRMCNRNRVDAADRRFEFALPNGSYGTPLLRAYLQSGPLDR